MCMGIRRAVTVCAVAALTAATGAVTAAVAMNLTAATAGCSVAYSAT
jgi:hypothetical protein